MKRILGLIAVLTLAGVANADWYTAYLNTYDSLDGITVSGPVDPNSPYLYDGGVWAHVPYGGTGYASIYTMMDPINGININPPIDFTYGEFTIELQWYSDWWIPGEWTGFWLRVYSREWDEGAGEWIPAGTQNYFYEVEMSGPGGGPGWQSWTRPVDDYDETDHWGTFYDDQVYGFRIDSVLWDPDLTPYSFGISHFEFVVPPCPHDLDGDDDVDLQDLALLLGQYGCQPVVSTLYDTGSFEAYNLGDLVGQDNWQTLGFAGIAQVVNDPTGGGMGQVVILDAADGGDLINVEHLLDTPITEGVVIYEWDQYRPDFGDNVWLCDDFNYDGWWAVQWDSASPPGQTSPAYWATGAPLTLSAWDHVRYEVNLGTRVARVQTNGGDIYEGPFTTDDMKGIEFEIQDTDIAGDGPIYLDNVVIKYQSVCPIDYNGDGYTNITDLALLLAEYGCVDP
jgi:hypothetical protein